MSARGGRAVMRRAIVVFTGGLATVAMSLAVAINAAPVRALEPLPGQFECGGFGSAGELPAGAWSLSGTVTDGLGAGIEGIRVKVRELVGGAPFGGEDTSSASDGTWSLDGLGDATYILSFSDGSEAHQNGWYDSGALVIGSENASPVPVLGASVAGIDVTLPDETPLILSGTVTDQASLGVEGILVTATDADFGIRGCAYTDAAGDWAMRIRTGRYVVRVDDSSGTFLSGFYDGSNPPTNFALANGDATRLDLTGDLADVDIQFPQLYAVEGVVSVGNDPIPGLFVSICGPIPSLDCIASDETDATGGYRVYVPNGLYAARVEDPTGTYRSGYRRGSTVLPDISLAEGFDVLDGDVDLIDISTFPNARASGSITGVGGAPLDGLDVQMCDQEQSFCGFATTDAAGVYVTGGLPPTDYTVRVSDATGNHPSGYLTTGNGFSQLPADAVSIAVGDADLIGVDVEIPDGYRISGTLLVNGAPAESRPVGVCPVEDWCVAEGSTDVDGSFATPAVLPGTYRLQTFTNDRVFYLQGADAISIFDDATGVLVVSADVSGIVFQVFEAPPGAETPEGTDVEVFPEDPNTGQAPVAVTFDSVTSEGVTSLSITDNGPETPAGFQLGDPPTWFEISTTASFVGNVEVCIYYGGLFADDSNLRLLHFAESADPPDWVDVTTSIDVDIDTICGLTDSFSPFAVVARTPIFGGFEAPVDDRPVVNKARAGSSIPVKFSLGGDFGLDILAGGSPSSVTTDCADSDIDAIESTVAAGSSGLSYDAVSGLYTYVWKTNKGWAGTCRTLILEFADGSERADFTFSR